MEECWKDLPNDLVFYIVDLSGDIDLRRAFGFLPRKLSPERILGLHFLLNSHDGLVYNMDTKSLHILRIPGVYVVRRPIELDYVDRWAWMFNALEESHTIEISCSSGRYCFVPDARDPFYTELKVLLKGSGMATLLSSTL
jgi:hypothetical protein